MKKKLGDYAVVLVKPDGVKKGIIGELVTRFEKVGHTFPSEAIPGTIRGDYSLDSAYESNIAKRTTRNLVHASGTKEEAEFRQLIFYQLGFPQYLLW